MLIYFQIINNIGRITFNWGKFKVTVVCLDFIFPYTLDRCRFHFCKAYNVHFKTNYLFGCFQINFALALWGKEIRFDYLPVITEAYPVYYRVDKMLQEFFVALIY